MTHLHLLLKMILKSFGGNLSVKKSIAYLILFTTFLLSSCSLNNSASIDRLNEYLEHWKKEEFQNMYDLLSKETKEKYSEEDFIERYEKIYEDLNVTDLKFSYPEQDTDALKLIQKEKQASIPLDVEMNTVAGIVQFTHDIALETEDDSEWKVAWNPGLIFPELEDGGKVRIEHIEPKRGDILDRNKMPLAINDIAYEVGVVPSDFKDKKTELNKLASLLHMSVQNIEDKLSESWVQDDFFVPLKKIPNNSKSTLSQLKDIPAVTLNETTGRTYPAAEAAAHLIGYIGPITSEEIKKYPKGTYKDSDIIGKRGLELLYEERLRGKEGIILSIVKDDDHQSEVIIAEDPVENGETIQLTIDINAQEQIFASFEGNAGSAAAVHPTTGEVLALVSSPSYDPIQFVYGITQANWDKLNDDPNKPFINRFAATYAPGSVIKPITGAIGLKNGSIKHGEGLTINGLRWGKKGWGDNKITRVSTSAGPVDLRDALIRSDNIYFAMKAVNMGSKKLVNGLHDFGFDEKIPFPIGISKSQVSNSGSLDEIQAANTSYGQAEIEISSLHMALTYTPFLNEGNMVKPILLIDEKKGEIWKEDLISKADAKEIQTALREVVTKGTAKVANDSKFPISGKTGTAELKLSKDSTGHENGWFVGFPTEKQDVILAMMVEKADGIGSSSYVASKVLESLKTMK